MSTMHRNHWTMDRHVLGDKHRKYVAKVLNVIDIGGILCPNCDTRYRLCLTFIAVTIYPTYRLASARVDSLKRHMKSSACSRKLSAVVSPSLNNRNRNAIDRDSHAMVKIRKAPPEPRVLYPQTEPSSLLSRPHERSVHEPRNAIVAPSSAPSARPLEQPTLDRAPHHESRTFSTATSFTKEIKMAPLSSPEEPLRSSAIVRLPSFNSFSEERLASRMANLSPAAILESLAVDETGLIPGPSPHSTAPDTEWQYRPTKMPIAASWKRPRIVSRAE